MSKYTKNTAILAEFLGEFEGLRLLDIGCGDGALLSYLVRRGAEAFGVEPNAEAVKAARSRVGEAAIAIGSAEMLEFEDATFDGAIIMNSLHHIDARAHEAALLEACRVVRPGGHVLIIEPRSHGGYFDVLKPLEDETFIRAEALSSLKKFLAEGGREAAKREYLSLIGVNNLEDLIAKMVRVDRSRAPGIEAARAKMEAAYFEHVIRDEKGRDVLEQPMIAYAIRC